ncbi:UNKNOWN [Stylonychia lemnae]|uniref:Uncharacterized protein n=1 Tax=Stylonychia lemnae TaxID=5949 RepID=A0A078B5J6_STYLE|nr:UNKNOWN [Stylonychia lemnae]|eukprot:CDW89689.1 UNKNOWN [Stylonychia lemnae]
MKNLEKNPYLTYYGLSSEIVMKSQVRASQSKIEDILLLVSTIGISMTIIIVVLYDINESSVETGSYIYALIALPAVIYSSITLINGYIDQKTLFDYLLEFCEQILVWE